MSQRRSSIGFYVPYPISEPLARYDILSDYNYKNPNVYVYIYIQMSMST